MHHRWFVDNWPDSHGLAFKPRHYLAKMHHPAIARLLDSPRMRPGVTEALMRNGVTAPGVSIEYPRDGVAFCLTLFSDDGYAMNSTLKAECAGVDLVQVFALFLKLPATAIRRVELAGVNLPAYIVLDKPYDGFNWTDYGIASVWCANVECDDDDRRRLEQLIVAAARSKNEAVLRGGRDDYAVVPGYNEDDNFCVRLDLPRNTLNTLHLGYDVDKLIEALVSGFRLPLGAILSAELDPRFGIYFDVDKPYSKFAWRDDRISPWFAVTGAPAGLEHALLAARTRP